MTSPAALHAHCESCIKLRKCSVRPQPGVSCEIVACGLDCGARFHACKLSEHVLLCPNEKVPCINAVNGCPVWLLRGRRSRHLETCPASVVHCTMEWNRWPVCSRERQMHIPFHQPNPNVKLGQLDVALALRDQRMLNEWLRAPRRTRRALRNGLTRRFPAVPLQQARGRYDGDNNNVASLNYSNDSSSHPSRVVTDDEEDTPWEMRKSPPGLQRSVCGELYRASKQASDCLTAALHFITSQNIRESAELSRFSYKSIEEDKENLNGVLNGWPPGTGVSAIADVEAMDVEPSTEARVLCSEKVLGKRTNRDNVMELSVEIPDPEALGGYDVLFVDNTVVSEISSASMTDHARKPPEPQSHPPPAPSPPLFVNLGLDLTLESITRYQTKPKSMYTFLCAQEFRRDEYSWHYKNVHSDIHGGLNGWLEQRCPLAHYGCMYSVRRFFPTCCGSTIVHNDILESFGVQPYIPYQLTLAKPVANSDLAHRYLGRSLSPERKASRRSPPSRCEKAAITLQSRTNSMDIIHEEGNDGVVSPNDGFGEGEAMILTQLPFEVLRHVARFLDSFSLCNLSMTTRLLREVCCSLLEERGIVVQQWEKFKNGQSSTWRVAYKRWFFSTAFTPIRRWGFEERDNMANHLKYCMYFHRNMKSEPYFYPMGAEPNPELHEKLRASAAEIRKVENCIGATTKL